MVRKKNKEVLHVRIELMNLGKDQVILALAIAWVAKEVLQVDTILDFESIKAGEKPEIGDFRGVLLELESGTAFIGSKINNDLDLHKILDLLHGPLKDLTIHSDIRTGNATAFELQIDFRRLQMLTFRDMTSNDPEDFTRNSTYSEATTEFAKKYMAAIDKRLRPMYFGS